MRKQRVGCNGNRETFEGTGLLALKMEDGDCESRTTVLGNRKGRRTSHPSSLRSALPPRHFTKVTFHTSGLQDAGRITFLGVPCFMVTCAIFGAYPSESCSFLGDDGARNESGVVKR